MAGRPKTMFKRVDQLVDEYDDFGGRFIATMPSMYRTNEDQAHLPLDPVRDAWRSALSAVTDGYLAMCQLRAELARKAEIDFGGREDIEPNQIKLDDEVILDGESATLREWCAEYENTPELVLSRIAAGMDVECAVTMPATG